MSVPRVGSVDGGAACPTRGLQTTGAPGSVAPITRVSAIPSGKKPETIGPDPRSVNSQG